MAIIITDIVQTTVIVLGFIGLMIYQHYKIKGLKEQTERQGELLENIKTYYEIMNPELLKFRIETLEKTLEEKQKIQEENMKGELAKAFEQRSRDLKAASQHIKDLLGGLLDALFKLPKHEMRKSVVASMKSGMMKEIIELQLPKFIKWDKEREDLWVNALESYRDVKTPPPEIKSP
jgi:hypothetical protein